MDYITAKQFLINKINNCYKINVDKKYHWIYFVYSNKITRQKKLCRITNSEFIYEEDNDEIVLFKINLDKEYFVISYKIFDEIIKNYGLSYLQLKTIMNDVCLEMPELKKYSKNIFVDRYER